MRLQYIHPQLQQLANLSLLLLLGKYAAHIYLSWLNISIILIFALFIEHTFLYLKDKKLRYFSFSSLSTAMGVILMMASPHLWIYMIVIALGLLQKHILVLSINNNHKRHFFNPSNFALLMSLLFFYKEAHIILGQLGDDLWLELVVGLLAILMLLRVDRWIIPLGFSVAYLLLQYFLVIQYDPVMLFEELYRRFYSVSFIVFILFMLTDPKTTPAKHQYQLLFALFAALVATLLDVLNGFRVQHLFLSLSLISVCIPLLEFFEEPVKYKMGENIKRQLIVTTALILLMLIGVIFSIEQKQPYYFSMDT